MIAVMIAVMHAAQLAFNVLYSWRGGVPILASKSRTATVNQHNCQLIVLRASTTAQHALMSLCALFVWPTT
jgi:hypothetical protein